MSRDLSGYKTRLQLIFGETLFTAAMALLGAVLAMLYFAFKTLQLPRALKRLTLGRPPRAGEPCIVRHEMRDRSAEHAQFDLVLYGEDQSVILAVEGFRFVIVPPKTAQT